MNFIETVDKVKAIIALIEAYGKPVKETLKSVKWIFNSFKLEKVSGAIDFLINTEPIIVNFVLDAIKRIEELSAVTGLKGDAKLSQALTIVNEKDKPKYTDLINTGVGVINLFSGAEK